MNWRKKLKEVNNQHSWNIYTTNIPEGKTMATKYFTTKDRVIDDAHRIEIEVVDKGYIAEVGCKKLVFETKKKLLMALDEYLTNPKKATKKYLKEE